MSETQNSPVVPELLPWHERPWAHVMQLLTLQRFPHALLLSGPRGVGKLRFAQRLAAALTCESSQILKRPCGECRACQLSRVGTHPDIQWLNPEEEGKEIRVDAVRSLIGRSTLTTLGHGMRVLLISPADALNPSAANALLKTLEEPVPSSVLILISSAPHRLPATILSRCQKLSFQPVEPALARSWLQARDDQDRAGLALSMAGGAPLLAQKYLLEGSVEQVMGLIQDLQALKSRKGDPVAIASRWAELGAGKVLDGLRRILSDLLRLTTASHARLFTGEAVENLQVLIKNIHLQNLFQFTDELYLLERQLGHNLNAQMLSQRLINSWLTITRIEKH